MIRHVEDGLAPLMYLHWQATPGSSPRISPPSQPSPVPSVRPGAKITSPLQPADQPPQRNPQITQPLYAFANQPPQPRITRPLTPDPAVHQPPGVPFIVTQPTRAEKVRNWSRQQWRRFMRTPAVVLVNRTQDYRDGFDNGFEQGHNRGCRRGCAASALLAIVLGLGITGATVGLNSCANAQTTIRPAGGSTPFSLSDNDCKTIPANSVIDGDVNENGNVVNGTIVGGTNLYDSGPNSATTGLVVVTTQPTRICAPFGASGRTFNSLDDATRQAQLDANAMKQNGCATSGCSGGVTITRVP